MDKDNVEEKKESGYVDIIQALEKLGFEVLEIKKDYRFKYAIGVLIKKK